MLLILINENVKGDYVVSYGEFLQWIGLWFLMATLISPSRAIFISDGACDRFLDALFRLAKNMSRKRFNQMFVIMRYTDKYPQSNRFFELRHMLKVYNYNL